MSHSEKYNSPARKNSHWIKIRSKQKKKEFEKVDHKNVTIIISKLEKVHHLNQTKVLP